MKDIRMQRAHKKSEIIKNVFEEEKLKNPKILVGCPTSDYKEYCLDEYAEAVKNLDYPCCDILLIDNSKTNDYFKKLKEKNLSVEKSKWFEGAMDRIVTSRNMLRQKVIDKNYDYLFSLEQDVIPPKNILRKLVSQNKKIISAVYFNPKQGKHIPLLAINRGLSKLSYIPEEIVINSNKIIKVDYCGLGAVLIHRSVLEKIMFRKSEKPGFDDWWFCKDAKKEGFEIYADLSIKCKHLIKNRPWKWGEIKL